jgi:hypothetical protein
VFVAHAFTGIPAPDGKEIDMFAYFPLHELPKPMPSFTVQRIKDAAAFNGIVHTRVQHISEYVIE